MRDLLIKTIEKNFEEGLDEIGRNLYSFNEGRMFWQLCYSIQDNPKGNAHLLNPFLKSLPDEALLGVFESQMCQRYR